MKKLKERWDVTSNLQLIIIFIVFAITGFSSLQLAKPFLNLIGIQETFEPHWLYRVMRIVLIFPYLSSFTSSYRFHFLANLPFLGV